MEQLVPSPQVLAERLAGHDYLADPGLATALFCAVRLPQPLLLEGEAGGGKTQAAKALAALLDTPLIRLQCYEGIDASEAIYEWNYPRQLLGIRVAEAQGRALDEESLFSREFLIERPLLQALEHPGPNPAVLLIDEVDRADEEFEAFLFEMLAEGSLTVPELGTLTARVPPIVVLTSNRTRDLHDALKRRCLGVAEAIDWVHAAMLLGIEGLDAAGVGRTLGSVLKYREDQELARSEGLAWVAGS